MALTMKDLEGRQDAQGGALEALERRVAALEDLTGAGHPGAAEVDQEAADRAILTRFATTREEALEQDAARARMEERGLEGPDWTRPEQDEDDEEAPEVPEPAPAPPGA